MIEKLAAKTELRKVDVEVAVDSVLAMIEETLRSNERVDIRGFGSFVVKERKERQGRNPRSEAGRGSMLPAEKPAVAANAPKGIGITVRTGGATWLR